MHVLTNVYCISYIVCVCVPFVRINPLVWCYEITSNLFNSCAFFLFCSAFLLSLLLSGCGIASAYIVCSACVCEWVRCFITQIITLQWNSVFVRWISKATHSTTYHKPNQTQPLCMYIRLVSISYNSFLHFHYALDCLLFGIQMTYKHTYTIQFVRAFGEKNAMKWLY